MSPVSLHIPPVGTWPGSIVDVLPYQYPSESRLLILSRSARQVGSSRNGSVSNELSRALPVIGINSVSPSIVEGILSTCS